MQWRGIAGSPSSASTILARTRTATGHREGLQSVQSLVRPSCTVQGHTGFGRPLAAAFTALGAQPARTTSLCGRRSLGGPAGLCCLPLTALSRQGTQSCVKGEPAPTHCIVTRHPLQLSPAGALVRRPHSRCASVYRTSALWMQSSRCLGCLLREACTTRTLSASLTGRRFAGTAGTLHQRQQDLRSPGLTAFARGSRLTLVRHAG